MIILSQVSVLHLSFPSSSYRKVINSDGFKGSLSIKSLIKCSVCSLIHVRHWPTSLCLQKVYCFSFLQVLPYPVYFHSATVTPSGCMYVFGGVKTLNSNEDTRSNDIFKLWLTLPSLVERCWEVVTNCFQDKRTLLADAMQMGIPQHFLERLK